MGFREDLTKGIVGKLYSIKTNCSEGNIIFRVEGMVPGNETF